jgi:hypothetical protein
MTSTCVLGQDSIDSIQAEGVNKNSNNGIEIFNSGWQNHNHIFDYQIVTFEANRGALGYTYLFKPFVKWKFGARFGGWYRETGQDVPAFQARKNYVYSASLVVNYSVWKGLNIQSETGLSQVFSKPFKSNTTSVSPKWERPIYDQRLILNTIFYKHFIVNMGYQISYDPLPNIFYSYWLFGLGLKI